MGPGRYSVRLINDQGVEIWHRHVLVEAGNLPRRPSPKPARTDLNTGDYSIRTYRPGDEHEINALFNEVFGQKRTIAEWEKKFRAFGREPRIVLIVDRAGRIVTHYAACEVPFEIDGKAVVVCQIVDVFSVRREAAVSRQFFVKAANAFIDKFCGPDGISATYGFPGPRAYRLGQHVWEYRAFAPVTVWKVELGRPDFPSWAMSLVDSIEAGLEAHGPAVDQLWEKARHLYAAGVCRDSTWLTERYFRCDAGKYRSVFLRDAGGMRAWAVFALEGERGAIADIVWDGAKASAVRTVLGSVRCEARRRGASQLELWSPAYGPLAEALRADGWTSEDHPGGAYHVVQSFDGRVDEIAVRASMFYALGDSDLI
jgi:hypothetical protein